MLEADEAEATRGGRRVEQYRAPGGVEDAAVEDQRRGDKFDAHAAKLGHFGAAAGSRIEVARLPGGPYVVEPRRRRAHSANCGPRVPEVDERLAATPDVRPVAAPGGEEQNLLHVAPGSGTRQ